jgi:four helix bundle protein
MAIIKYHTELKVYQKSFDVAMEIFKISFKFPIEEKYSLTDQIRRSSRSVSANISEAWGKRRYPKSFVSKLTDAEGEARETQTWLEYSFHCNYITEEQFRIFNEKYNEIIAMIIYMINNVEKWTNFNSKE